MQQDRLRFDTQKFLGANSPLGISNVRKTGQSQAINKEFHLNVSYKYIYIYYTI